MEILKKVIVTGHFGVGKTSLVRRFVHQKFSDQYLTTIGVKIDKKEVKVKGANVKMMLWDIAGESSAAKIPRKYVHGAHGIVYVFDLTREETYENINADLFELQKNNNAQVPTLIFANKADLVEPSFIEEVREKINISFKVTSAKEGNNVEDGFLKIASEML